MTWKWTIKGPRPYLTSRYLIQLPPSPPPLSCLAFCLVLSCLVLPCFALPPCLICPGQKRIVHSIQPQWTSRIDRTACSNRCHSPQIWWLGHGHSKFHPLFFLSVPSTSLCLSALPKHLLHTKKDGNGSISIPEWKASIYSGLCHPQNYGLYYICPNQAPNVVCVLGYHG